MATLFNTTARDIELPARHIIPANAELTTTNDVIRGDNWTMLQGLVNSGAVIVKYDPEPDAAPMAIASIDAPIKSETPAEKPAKAKSAD